MPTVSVIIPAYNAARTVGAAVDSVLEQTFDDLELLVVDDGSSDETAGQVGARGDSRLRCLRTDNHGVSQARNRGLAEATGEWVGFLDADDVWRPTKVARQLEVIAQLPAAGLVFTAATVVDHRLQPTGLDAADLSADYVRDLLLLGNVISGGGSSVLVRRSLVDQVGGFDARLSQCADWDLWLRLSLVTSFAPIADPLVLYRKVAGTMSSNPSLLERDTFTLLDKFYAGPAAEPYWRIRDRVYANHWMICAGTYLDDRRLREAVRCVAHGLRSDIRTAHRPLAAPGRRIRRAWIAKRRPD